MSITKINAVPNIEDLQDFLVQSLANLGQRLGVKGDSIKANSFIFKDILGEQYSAYNPNKTVGIIERENGILKIYIADRKTLLPVQTPEYVTEYQSTLVFGTNKEVESSINGISAYKANSYFTTLKNNRYVFCGIGQYQGVDSDFVYEEYDKTTNNLLNGLRLTDISKDVNNPNIVAVVFSVISNDSVDIEIFNIQGTKLSDILPKINEKIQGLYKTNENAFGIINESKLKSVDVEYWINFLRLPRYGDNYKKYKDIHYTVGNETTDLQYTIDIEEKDLIQLFHYDRKETLPKLQDYYTTEIYNLTNYSFKKQILFALFNKIYYNAPYNCKLYIPVDYIFNYYCNSNDEWKIFGGIQDIPVKFVKSGTLNKSNFDKYYGDGNIWIGTIDDSPNQTALYNYSVEYSADNKFVYNIFVEKKYTLPFINDDNYWVIDGDDTNVKAKGEDAGNPNIVLVYSFSNNSIDPKNGIDYKILTSFDNEMLEELETTWKLTSVKIEPIERINLENPSIVTNSSLLNIGCYVPDLTYVTKLDLLSKLENALIINISSINCFDKITDEMLLTYGENGVVTTLWKLNSKRTKFEPVANPKFDKTMGAVALDIVHLTNLNNLVKWHIMNHEPKHPDRYTHSWLVFDNAKKETKNNINDYRTYIYPVIANKSSEEYYSGNYINDFNLTVKFLDMIAGAEEQDIQSISQSSNKFFTSSNINVTNTLYNRRLESNSRFKTFEEYIPNVDMPVFDLSEVLTKDQNLLNRTNIITFSESGTAYYSYIGSAFDDSNKNRIHFGSSKININLGTDTMVPLEVQENLFTKQTELDIDFENTFINGYAYVSKDLEVGNDIRTGHINWEVRKMSDKTVWSTTFVPTSKLMIQQNPNEKQMDFMSILQFNNYKQLLALNNVPMINEQIKRYFSNATFVLYYSNKFNAKLWIPSFYLIENNNLFRKPKLIYYGEALYLPGLLCRLGLNKFITNLNKIVSLKSNMEIIRYQNIPIMLMTSNKFLENLSFNYNDNNAEIGFTIDNNESFTGNSLEISYYIDQSGNLHLTVNEFTRNQKIGNLFKLKLEY